MKKSFPFSRLLLIILFATGSFLSSIAQQSSKISLLFIGDVMGHDEQIWSAENRETHQFSYDDVFQYISPVIEKSDIAIANLEVTLAGPPYTGYPQFSSPSALAAACKNAGIDCFVTANNHAADRSRKGIAGTIFRLDSLGIPHTGTFLSKEAHDSLTPLVITKNGFSFALLNYTFSTNGIPVPEPVIVNMIDKEKILEDINRAKQKKTDMIITFLHWGTEYDSIPSAAQTTLAVWLHQQGVDLVIGSHPHVLQRMENEVNISTGKPEPIIYSLGNFVSNQRRARTDGGSIVRIEISKENGVCSVANAGYILTWVYTPIMKYRKKFYVLPCQLYENNEAFFDRPEAYSAMKRFVIDSRKLLSRQNKNVNEYIIKDGEWILSSR
jgi:poly-gamma-glutamate capsule biosynthesis protein CapA/YwtB (metallophosphatase superfamily)